MPELPEVETVRQGLNQMTLTQEIVGGDVLLDRTIAPPISVENFLATLKGAEIVQWHRRGKYLLAQLQKTRSTGNSPQAAGWLGIHLRMTGQLLWIEPDAPLQKHTRVRLFFAGESQTTHQPMVRELRFVDQRTFGRMWWVPPDSDLEAIVTGLKKLGPEPLSDEFSVHYLAQQMTGRQRAIKTALLDQAIIAGIGNIYADEALFLSAIAPTQICSTLTNAQIQQLHHSIIQVLKQAIASGGTTFSHFLNVKGVNGNYAGIAWVYNRTGQPCRVCSTPIQRLKLNGRSSHFCPQCQGLS